MTLKPLPAATALAAILALSTPAYAGGGHDWDTDNQSGVNSTEYRAGFESTGAFDDWDVNDDNMLSQDEFDDGLGDNNTAFHDRFGDNYFDTWDADKSGGIDENEFYDGTYSAYDRDGNDMIDEPELGDLDDDMGDEGFWDV